MQLSDVSIQRPVFASVLSLLLLVGGFAALWGLPVREYPAIDPPIVSVTTAYRGAANEVIENRITEDRLPEPERALVRHHRIPAQPRPGCGGCRCARPRGAHPVAPA
jgi:hypothetical protein